MRIIGADFETWYGEPRLFVAYDGEKRFFHECNKKTVLPMFLDFLRPYISQRREQVLCWFHGLHHDLVSILYDYPQAFHEQHFTVQYDEVDIEAFFYKRIFGFVRFPNARGTNATARLLDSWAFFPQTLESLAEDLNLGVEKMKRPKNIGKVHPREYLTYALRDAEVQYRLACKIMEFHKDYDIDVTVSAPHFAQRVFRHKYVSQIGEKRIVPPPDSQKDFCMASYRGGKNGLYCDPGFYRSIVYSDIVSAYPWAMTQLPSLVEGTGRFKWVKSWPGEKTGKNGIYRVWGHYPITTKNLGKYSPFCGPNFEPIFGEINAYMITGPELAQAIRTGYQMAKADGVVWEENSRASKTPHPLALYARDFFKKKNATKKDDPRYPFFKLLLNSLYGKFMQRIPIKETTVNVDSGVTIEPTYQTGALFNPFIGSLITGWVRALIFEHENRYGAMHTATDSIISRRGPRKSPSYLGTLQPQYRGDLLLLRNKLYILFKPGTEEVLTYALHGFHGTLKDLIRMWKKKKTSYKTVRMNQIKESLKHGLVPLLFEEREMTLDVDWEKIK